MLRVVAGFLLALLCGSLFADDSPSGSLADRAAFSHAAADPRVPVASFIILALVAQKAPFCPPSSPG